ncbi:MAG: cobalt-precorrin-5B (C(1))-methyltransferase CbiD [Candidatus Bathyarchaeota archaeon]|nr:cobalt-precorrin-5B (C(1))-methyltransferase CbiD [Candidatus Bathyarchaeum sp.]
MRRVLKYGNTTGAYATAAAKAALITLLDKPVDRVGIPSPLGIRFEILIKECKKLSDDTAIAYALKNAGEDIDVTDKMEIFATVKLTDDGKISIAGGKGVGTVTKQGLPVAVGEAAINPTPRKMIKEAIKEVLPSGKGVKITISAPEGEEVAKKTQNSKLGIVGGVSILGTTGVVRPLSIKSYRRSLVPQLDVALAQNYEQIFLVPGNIGEKLAKKIFNIPEDSIVQTGDFMGYMLQKAVEKGAKNIAIFGHPGKLVKLAAGIFNTHHKMGDARMEIIAAYAGAAGADTKLIQKIVNSNTTEEAIQFLEPAKLIQQTFNPIAEQVYVRSLEKIGNKAKINVIIVSMNGTVLGTSKNVRSFVN